MNASIRFNEITELVERKYGQKINISQIDNKSIEISYKRLIIKISITLRIASIDKDCIQLTYDGSAGIPTIISGVVALLGRNIPEGVEVNTSNNTVKIFPQKIEQLQKALEFVTLNDVVFDNDHITATLSLK